MKNIKKIVLSFLTALVVISAFTMNTAKAQIEAYIGSYVVENGIRGCQDTMNWNCIVIHW
jgi:hypothetical protein